MTATIVQQAVLYGCASLLVWAAVSDMRSYVIPNRIVVALVAIYPVYLLNGLLGGVPVDWSGGVLAAALVFVLGFVLFNMHVIGGGDVKLLSAVALWTGLNELALLLVVVGMAGGVLSLAIVAAKTATLMRLPADIRAVALPVGRFPMLKAALRAHAPYGAAIAFGGLFIIYRLIRA